MHAKNPIEKNTGTLRECYNRKFPYVKAGLILLVAGTECEYTVTPVLEGEGWR